MFDAQSVGSKRLRLVWGGPATGVPRASRRHQEQQGIRDGEATFSFFFGSRRLEQLKKPWRDREADGVSRCGVNKPPMWIGSSSRENSCRSRQATRPEGRRRANHCRIHQCSEANLRGGGAGGQRPGALGPWRAGHQYRFMGCPRPRRPAGAASCAGGQPGGSRWEDPRNFRHPADWSYRANAHTGTSELSRAALHDKRGPGSSR